MKNYLLIIITFFPGKAFCQHQNNADSGAVSNTKTIIVHKQKPFHFITNVPGNVLQIAKSPFRKENLKGLCIVAGATALLLPLDQAITDGVKHFSREIHFDPETDYKVPIKFGKTKILKIPQNLNSAFYQLGEGGTSMLVAGGLYLYGKIKHDKRAVYTASDLTETFITMGVSTQIIKRISGRQSPFAATQRGGKWSPFPSFKNYQTNTGNYDAFPSGHLATMMATVSTLIMNYPEKKWIKPVGYGLMTLTSLAMINTDVHWISDYPLALALGYISAKITHLKNHSRKEVRAIPEM